MLKNKLTSADIGSDENGGTKTLTDDGSRRNGNA